MKHPTANPEAPRAAVLALLLAAVLPTRGAIEAMGGARMDLGTFPNWESREVVFRLRNTGERQVSISRVETTCGCTVPRRQPTTIAPRAEEELRVEIPPKSLSGAFIRHLYVRTDDPVTPRLSLTIAGTARPLVEVHPTPNLFVDRLPLEPQSWTFRLMPTQPGTRFGTPRFATARPDALALSYTPAEDASLSVTVSLPPVPTPGDLACAIIVPIAHPEGQAPVHLGIAGKLGRELYVIPGILQLPLSPVPLTRSLCMRLATPDGDDALDADSVRGPDMPGVTVRDGTAIPGGQGLRCTLELTPAFLRNLARDQTIVLTFRVGDAAPATLECRHLPHGLTSRPVF